MTSAEIVREIQQLPFHEQFRLHRILARLLHRQGPIQTDPPAAQSEPAAAARALLADYQSDPELTAFTSLDSEDFHATR